MTRGEYPGSPPGCLSTPEAWWEISQGLSECNERNPWFMFPRQKRTPEGCEDTTHASREF